MKTKWLMFVAVLAVTASLALASSYERSLLFEDFESITPPGLPAGWMTLNANGDAGVWETRSYSGVNWGRQCIRYISDPANPGPADDWFFTSGVFLDSGKQYTLEFRYRCSSSANPEAMSVFAGTAQNPASMTTGIWSDPAIANTEYALATCTSFGVAVSGTYYLGFHAESPPYRRRLYVDDVNLLVPEDRLAVHLFMAKQLQGGGSTYSPGDSIECVVSIQNVGPDPIIINRELSLGAGATDTQLGFDITGPDGFPVPIVSKYEKGGPPVAADFQVVYPDSVVGKVVDLWGWYLFGPPGQYLIQAHYMNYADPDSIGAWKGEIVSDPTPIILE